MTYNLSYLILIQECDDLLTTRHDTRQFEQEQPCQSLEMGKPPEHL